MTDPVYPTIADCVGQTPLVRLQRMLDDRPLELTDAWVSREGTGGLDPATRGAQS